MATPTPRREAGQIWSFRGSKSRNKVTVGEPAVGSLPMHPPASPLPLAPTTIPVLSVACGAWQGGGGVGGGGERLPPTSCAT